MSLLEIRETKKYGRGLYAMRNIRKGEVVEISPVVVLHSHEVNASKLNLYVFGWRCADDSALALGLGSLFNHSEKRPNVTYQPCFANKNITFFALKNIKKNHQLFINYGYDPRHGIEVTERNIFTKLKQKFEPEEKRDSFPIGIIPTEEKTEEMTK